MQVVSSLLTFIVIASCIAIAVSTMESESASENAGAGASVHKVLKKRRQHVASDGTVREYDPATRSWHVVEANTNTHAHTSASGNSGTSTSTGAEQPLLQIEGRAFSQYTFTGDSSTGKELFVVGGLQIVAGGCPRVRASEAQLDGDTGLVV